MSQKLMYLLSLVLVMGLIGGVVNADPLRQDTGPDGIVSVEAEDYDANVEVGGHAWVETGPIDGFIGEAGMHAPNGQGGHGNTDYAANSERLEYEIEFEKTGPHYVWILALGADGTDDSCHAGLDGEEIGLLIFGLSGLRRFAATPGGDEYRQHDDRAGSPDRSVF